MEWLSSPTAGYEFVTTARHWTLCQLEAAGRTRAHVDAVTLVTSELVTNALMYATGPVSVGVEVHAHDTRVEVWDGSPETDLHILPIHPAHPTVGGWGLELVAQFSDRWGTTHTTQRKCVWCEIGA